MAERILPDYPPMMTLTGSKIPVDGRFATALASVVLEWSRAEMSLQSDLEGMRRYPGIGRLARRMPLGFEPTLALWRKSFHKLYPTVEAYQTFADYIEETAADLSKRNLLIHGIWAITGPDAAGAWTVQNYKRVKGGTYEVWRSSVDAERLEGTAASILKLSGDILGFVTSKMLHQHNGILKASSDPS